MESAPKKPAGQQVALKDTMLSFHHLRLTAGSHFTTPDVSMKQILPGVVPAVQRGSAPSSASGDHGVLGVLRCDVFMSLYAHQVCSQSR